MSTIKQVNAMFRAARSGDGKVDAKEAKQIARAVSKGGVTATEGKAVAAKLHPKERATKNRSAFADSRPAPVRERKTKNRSAFDAGPKSITPAAQKVLQQVVNSAPQRATSASAATGVKNVGTSTSLSLAERAAKYLGSLRQPQPPGPSATVAELAQFQRDSQRYNEAKAFGNSVIQTAGAWPKPLPNIADREPPMPGPDATVKELAQFQLDLGKFDAAVKRAVAGKPPVTGNNNAYGLGQQAVNALGSVNEPQFPGKDATEQQLAQYQQASQRYAEFKSLATGVIKTVTGLPNPIPGHLTVPPFPGKDASLGEIAKFQVDLQKFVAAAKAGATANPSSPAAPSQPTPFPTPQLPPVPGMPQGGTIEDKAAYALGQLKEPPFPGKDATEAELAQFQKDLGKYNRMYEMMSKIMANSHEMKKAVIGNLPR